jgi:hypothetical protein
MTTIDILQTTIDPQAAVLIDADADKYIPADARHVSRILKAAGHRRAERIPRSSNYTYGFHVTDNDLSIYRVNDFDKDEALALLEACVATLRAKGLVVVRYMGSKLTAHTTLHVFKPVTTGDDEATFFRNLRSTYVAQDSTLVRAWDVPALQQAKKALDKKVSDNIAKQKAQEKADREHAENLRKNLEAAGLPCSVNGNWIHVHAGQLNSWLQAQGVFVGKI